MDYLEKFKIDMKKFFGLSEPEKINIIKTKISIPNGWYIKLDPENDRKAIMFDNYKRSGYIVINNDGTTDVTFEVPLTV